MRKDSSCPIAVADLRSSPIPIHWAMSVRLHPDALAHMMGKNIGDLLTAARVTWGFFEGGFDLTSVNENGEHRLSAQHNIFVDQIANARLSATPRAVSVLCFNCQSQTRASILSKVDRNQPGRRKSSNMIRMISSML